MIIVELKTIVGIKSYVKWLSPRENTVTREPVPVVRTIIKSKSRLPIARNAVTPFRRIRFAQIAAIIWAVRLSKSKKNNVLSIIV